MTIEELVERIDDGIAALQSIAESLERATTPLVVIETPGAASSTTEDTK
jgi:hypothetical protein